MNLFTSVKSMRTAYRPGLGLVHVLSLILTAGVLFFGPHPIATAQTVDIPDPALRAALQAALGKEAGADITQAEMASLKTLDAFDRGIRNLTGLEFATNLTELHLGLSRISDVSVLSALTNLTYLDLHRNLRISDVAPLSALTNLTHLVLRGNAISDIAPLTALTNLTYLHLAYNEISDIALLSVLAKLTFLDLETNMIEYLSPLSALTNLTYIDLDCNAISDVAPLSTLTQLGHLDISDNQIPDISPLQSLKQLAILDFDSNEVEDVAALSTLRRLRDLDLHENKITDIAPLSTLRRLTVLDADENRIVDVAPLSTLTNLKDLDLDGNQIVDVAPLSTLTNLIVLDLDGNQIVDVAPLSTLTNLMELDLHENRIADFSALAGLIGNLVEYDASDQTDPPTEVADVNGDSVVNIQDLTLVASRLGMTGPNPADVNRDGIVNIQDLVLVAGALGTAAGAPSETYRDWKVGLTSADVRQWLLQAQQLDVTNPAYQHGIAVLEQLLATLTPKQTVLLPNYPNPGNPETWIPYQLAQPAEVTLTIYAANGTVVRTLAVGNKPAGLYENHSRAAYWNGRNETGEPVASGVYFYTLTAGNFTATRKMLIRK